VPSNPFPTLTPVRVTLEQPRTRVVMGRASILILAVGVLAIVIVLGVVLGPTHRARSPVADRPELFGVNVNRVLDDDFVPAHWDAPLGAVRASGVRQVRSEAFWMWAEHSQPNGSVHAWTWGMLDTEADAFARHDLRWFPTLAYSALWAATDRSNYHSPPRSMDDYAAYARAFAQRYGRGGSFWAEHHYTHPMPVIAYEIWNEPNNAAFWRPAPNAGLYAEMYVKARAAIHAVDPRATVVVGGLVAETSFVRSMYAARPDLRHTVDAMGWHSYAPTATGAIGGVRSLRQTLDQLGEADVPIYLTELGWPTHGTGTAKPLVMREPARGAALEREMEVLAHSDCGVEAVMPYTWMAPERHPNRAGDWYGLRHRDGSSSPSSEALARVATRWQTDPPSSAPRYRTCHPGSLG
jgi:hypothetical protein